MAGVVSVQLRELVVRRFTLRRRFADPGVRQQNRQQNQVGENQRQHADRRCDSQILDDRNLDDHQHSETYGVRHQRHQPG
ncbi:hypothetical protein D3C76_1103690 [compost metagenome]